MLVQPVVTEALLLAVHLEFGCSNEYIDDFLKRSAFGFRQGRAARRSEIDDADCVSFATKLAKVSQSETPTVEYPQFRREQVVPRYDDQSEYR
jgi:hypothetical protein